MVIYQEAMILILITIDELQGDIQQQIEDLTGLKTYIKDIDKHIPYEDIEILITFGLKEDWSKFEQMSSLKWIQVFQTGVEHVPFSSIEARGIPVTNVRNIYGTPISEYVMGIILYEIKHLNRFIKNKRLKRYDRTILTDEAGNKTIGIFGTGAIGKEVAKKAKAFHMNVLGFNSNGRDVSNFDQVFTWDQKETMLQQCDFIVLLLPLTDETVHFLNDSEFSLMKDNAYIINVGRGPLINEQALLRALENEKIKGAALDVFEEEPLSASSPLWEMDKLLLTPHLSGKTVYFYNRCMDIFTENFLLFQQGKRLSYLIDYVKGY